MRPRGGEARFGGRPAATFQSQAFRRCVRLLPRLLFSRIDARPVAEHHPPRRAAPAPAAPASKHPHEVQRIPRAHPRALPRALQPPHAAKRVDRLGERVLLAEKPGHEAPPSRQPARLAPPQRSQHVAPRHGEALARRQLAEDDAVAREELTGDAIRQLVARERLPGSSPHERPAARDRPSTAAARASPRRHQIPQRREPVPRDEPAAHQIPQRARHLVVARGWAASVRSSRKSAPRARSVSSAP